MEHVDFVVLVAHFTFTDIPSHFFVDRAFVLLDLEELTDDPETSPVTLAAAPPLPFRRERFESVPRRSPEPPR